MENPVEVNPLATTQIIELGFYDEEDFVVIPRTGSFQEVRTKDGWLDVVSYSLGSGELASVLSRASKSGAEGFIGWQQGYIEFNILKNPFRLLKLEFLLFSNSGRPLSLLVDDVKVHDFITSVNAYMNYEIFERASKITLKTDGVVPHNVWVGRFKITIET